MIEDLKQEDKITIPFEEYIDLLADRSLLKQLEKLGLKKLPMYDTAMINTFLEASRKYGLSEKTGDRKSL